ncbi:cytotoxic translational repressor of toxin-antitoxin stability system [Kibdelosporangium philippinense]|uniref:Cytotoxic translational repressor of toxin-antitoxin stability system n=1 Tax=Kibdelosporangium philippinense TaxID=211113 RepID=A0ABS8ZMF9_9PSEU|nr:cytotoxic translational repressor of toxin-antitoxin stability system [Kibdelosporangium philippinense]MCE7008985.1 cytotoxic translational repressor of toxin-antitoxin stability system [Kibdelosporangium philippinense]
MSEQSPTPADHDRFCQIEGWIGVRSGTHITYELGLPDGRVLRTRLSDRQTYGPDLWQHILRDQLEVDEPTFWACVNDSEKPDRGIAKPRPDALPVDLVHLLITRLGLPERTVATMTRKEAIARIDAYWEQSDGA